ncbi:MAG: TolC family protein [bacterium]
MAEERLRSQTRRFEVGLSISHDVLEYQEKLSETKSRELRARIDYCKSLAQLEQTKGTLLQSKGIGL